MINHENNERNKCQFRPGLEELKMHLSHITLDNFLLLFQTTVYVRRKIGSLKASVVIFISAAECSLLWCFCTALCTDHLSVTQCLWYCDTFSLDFFKAVKLGFLWVARFYLLAQLRSCHLVRIGFKITAVGAKTLKNTTTLGARGFPVPSNMCKAATI